MGNAIGNIRQFASSIRGRSVLLSMAVVTVAMALGSWLLLQAYEGRLVSSLDTTLEQQVDDRVRLISAGGQIGNLTAVFDDEAFAWIGTPDGQSSATAGSITPIDNPIPPLIGQTTTLELLVEERSSDEPGEVERERAEVRVASGVTADNQVVLAGAELETVDKAVSDLGGLFLRAIPFVIGLIGVLAWFTAGRALAPVEAIRRQAEEIGGSTLSERVPVPNSHDEISDLATTVNGMLDRLENHTTAMRQFSSDASHELKSPIANIRALVETRSSTDAAWPELQRQLVGETERLAVLVENLLFLATRSDLNRLSEVVDVQLDEILFSEAELVSATSAIRVEFREVEPITVPGSAADLGRLVRNLVDNAVRHANERIVFGLQRVSGETVLTVADDGPGISPADRERVFDRFTRLDEARDRDSGGTGLGLSIVREIAQAHGAAVTASESSYGGAEFIVRWS